MSRGRYPVGNSLRRGSAWRQQLPDRHSHGKENWPITSSEQTKEDPRSNIQSRRSGSEPSSAGRGHHALVSGPHHDFDAAVLLVPEGLIEIGAISQRRAVRDDEG